MRHSRHIIVPLWFVVFLLIERVAIAHGDLHERIAALSEQIADAPGNARLYLQRAELHRQHEDWTAALADCDKAAELDPGITDVDLLRGRTLLECGQPREALPVLERFLIKFPDH